MIDTQQTGIAFIPGTFPTSTVLRYLEENSAGGWSRGKVNDLYNAYKKSILTDGLKPYGPGQVQVKQHLITKYGFNLRDTTLFLIAVYNLVKAGNIKPYFLNFVPTKTGIKEIIKKAGSSLDNQVKTLKFFSVIAVLGVGLYFTWPLLTKGRKILKKRTR